MRRQRSKPIRGNRLHYLGDKSWIDPENNGLTYPLMKVEMESEAYNSRTRLVTFTTAMTNYAFKCQDTLANLVPPISPQMFLTLLQFYILDKYGGDLRSKWETSLNLLQGSRSHTRWSNEELYLLGKEEIRCKISVQSQERREIATFSIGQSFNLPSFPYSFIVLILYDANWIHPVSWDVSSSDCLQPSDSYVKSYFLVARLRSFV